MKMKGVFTWGTCLNITGLVMGLLIVVIDKVQSQRSTRWQEGSLRLVGGRAKNEGTVLVYHWSRWGAICDDYWDIMDANVVCNELGFAGAKEAPRRSRFGKGRRRVWLSGLHCRGNERHLTMCYSRGWGNHLRRCKSYWSSAGVVCNQRTTTTTTTTTTTPRPKTTTRKLTTTTKFTTRTTTPRPTTTTTPRPTTTTTLRPKTTTIPRPTTTATTTVRPTTTLRPTTTTSTKAPTTTRATTTTLPTTRKPTTTTEQPTTTTTTPTTTTTARKTTTKPTVPPPAYNKWIYDKDTWRYIMYFQDGTFITSRPDPRYVRRQNRTTTTTTTTTPRPTPRQTPRPQRVNYDSINNVIESDNNIGGNNLDVSLSNRISPNSPEEEHTRHEHHSNSHSHHRKAGYLGDQPAAERNRDLNLIDEDIDGTDQFLDDMTETNEIEIQPVSVTPTAPGYTEFRVLGGRNYTGYKEGRVEVRLANSFTWGVICGDEWELRAAIVACRHFNYGYARQAQTIDYYGGTLMDKVIAKLRCTGTEERLEDCTIEYHENTPGRVACSRPASVAGLICETRLPDLEPDLKAIEESIFLRDRYLYYLQCAYEEKCLSASANEIYGTRTWAYATRRLLHFSTIAKNIGTADFRPDIDRSQWEWHACHQHYHSMEAFSHYDIIDKHGNRIAEGHKASFCLEDSQCNRGVYPKYNCQGFGYQGISVGCQDSYLADIDCQWIDVTDVKPGTYTLKIELNPNMKVPEITFDNNVATCDLYFTSRQARVHNCKLDTLL